MEQLRVVGVEHGTLVLATETGERYGVDVDEVLRSELRRARREREEPARTSRPSPRDIQAQIRAGLSAEEAADVLGTTVEDIVRFEPPVLAEREFIVGQALSVAVLSSGDFPDDAPTTFGETIRAKLADAGASGETWTSWKEPTGWVVKLSFVAGDIERDARWSFEPRRGSLSPLTPDATQLSRQGSLPEGLIPRLRALDNPGFKDDSRFDSGAFGARHESSDTPVLASAAVGALSSSAATDAAIKRAPETPATSVETADLLEALRRRRGQRTGAPTIEDAEPSPASPSLALFDALDGAYDDESPENVPVPQLDSGGSRSGRAGEAASDSQRRKGRSALPSWDEIVFGARTDEN